MRATVILSAFMQDIVYKGMLTALNSSLSISILPIPSFESALGLVHSRFSTNTFRDLG